MLCHSGVAGSSYIQTAGSRRKGKHKILLVGAQDAAVAARGQTGLISQQQRDSWLKYTFRCTFCELIWRLANLISMHWMGCDQKGFVLWKLHLFAFPIFQVASLRIGIFQGPRVLRSVLNAAETRKRYNRDRCEPGPRLLLLVTMETLLNYRRNKMQIFHPLPRVLMMRYYPDSR